MLTPTGKPGEYRDTATGEAFVVRIHHVVEFSVGTFSEIPKLGTKNEALEHFATQAKVLLSATGSPHHYDDFYMKESYLSHDDGRWHFRILCVGSPLPLTPPQAEKVEG